MLAKRGLTLGKFLPLHEGHALLLRSAAKHCHELTVLVGVASNDLYSFEQRERWILDLLEPVTTQTGTRVHVVRDPDPDPLVEKDAEGTVTDERYWTQWLEQNQSHLANIDLVFTSDRYGREIARRIGARWFPVDPDREVVAISGSQIRALMHQNFHAVCDVAKPDVAITVAVLGAESTGKSTLVKRLADLYQTRYAPEWGRIISEAHSELTVSDFDAIVTMQDELITTAQRLGNGLCFVDTEAITTALFAPIYLGREHEASWQKAKQQQFDLYLVLDPSVPWIDDGTRVLDSPERFAFHESLIAALERLQKPYTLISGDSYDARERMARSEIDALLARRYHL
ncbi:MAG: AAA family ATPase [Pseudomonadota bacterium]